MQRVNVNADVLCVGGGIAGLMAAIRASEMGAKVVVAEKANTLHSGKGAMGNDHFQCYIPEVHGQDINAFIADLSSGQMDATIRTKGINFIKTWLERSFDIIKLWDKWGIPMKYQGKWEFAGHTYPGHMGMYLKYAGENQKLILTREALQAGVQIMNRVMIFELIGQDGVIGALGIDTREEKLIVFQTKSVILSSGGFARLYPSQTPAVMANITEPLEVAGNGRAMAYRVGAELSDMEMPGRHGGPKYFVRSGQATWVGVLRDIHGKPIGPFLSKPDRRYSDMATELNKSIFEDYMKSGRGPVYMDCTGISEEDFEYMNFWLRQEGNMAMLNHLKEENIDVRKTPIEFMTYGMVVRSGIEANDKSETSVKGLYAAGDESFVGISGAAVYGWVAGERAAEFAKKSEYSPFEVMEPTIEEKVSLFKEICARESGPDWKEVNIAVQQLMNDYAGSVRSDALLSTGLKHLQRLKQKAYSSVIARNQHELMRCLEVFDILELGELVITGAMERTESRGLHKRTDYQYTNPLLNNKILIAKKLNGKTVHEWRKVGN
jgi:succinate dehydrogenase/fumarate reductase flavoprotein subunit